MATRDRCFAAGDVRASSLVVDDADRTWLACHYLGTTTIDVGGFAIDAPADGSFVARLDVNGTVEHVEVNDAIARAIATWPDGRYAIASGRVVPASVTVEWFGRDGSLNASALMSAVGVGSSLALAIVAVGDDTDHVVLSAYASSAPSELTFENGAVALGDVAGSIVARVGPAGVVWAAAFETDDDAVLSVGGGSGRIVLAGSVIDSALADLLTGEVWLSPKATRTAFAAGLSADGSLSNVAFVGEDAFAAFPSIDDNTIFVSVESGAFPSVSSSLARVRGGVGVVSPETTGGSGSPLATAARNGFVVTSFISFGTTSFTALVPEALVDATDAFVVMRPTLSWLE